LRTFVAIELPDEVLTALAEAQQELKRGNADIRWVRPEGIHLTLKFLGEVNEDRLDEIIEKLGSVCRGHHSFELSLRGAGVFPNPRSPRVLWIGTSENHQLQELRDDIERAMEEAGFTPQGGKFVPHLTLGRFRSLRGKKAVMDLLKSMSDRQFGVVAVSLVSLMKSELGPDGARYSRLAGFQLTEP
jgi:2'-5' RNA ligase